MTVIALDPRWSALIEPAWIAALDETPLLRRAASGRASRAELYAFIAQQFHYSRHFTRYLCALMGNLKDEADRAELAENLFEELGLGEGGGVAHSLIYRRMMIAMGIDANAVPVHAATRALVEAMLSACADPDPAIGLGALCLGAEAIVPHVYSQILTGLRAIGEPEANLEFFALHIEADDEHAITLGKIIEREVAADPAKRVALRKSAQRLIAARAAFFRAVRPAHPFPLHVEAEHDERVHV